MHILSFFTREICLYSYDNIPIKVKTMKSLQEISYFIQERKLHITQTIENSFCKL